MKSLLVVLIIVAMTYYIIAKIVKWVSDGEHVPPASVLIPIIGIPLLILLSFLTIIPAQNCGVVVTPNGVKKESYNTGWHFVLPIYKVFLMDKTAQVYTCAKSANTNVKDADYKEYKAAATQSATVWAPTIDGIKMGFDISASWAIDPEYAWWIYDNVSEMDNEKKGRFLWLEENVIKAKLKSALALTVSKYNPIEVYSNKRQTIQDEVYAKMKQEIKAYHLTLNQIDVREVYYNDDYEKSINSKKLAEQEALRLIEVTKQKEEQLKQAEIEKNIAIQKAEGEAKSLQIKGSSIASNPRIIELEWINKWDGRLPNYMMGNGQGIMLNMNNKQ